MLVCYHFFHPDDVVGARMFSDLATEQVRRGWDVTALACNRSLRDPQVRLPAYEEWRPAVRQQSNNRRLLELLDYVPPLEYETAYYRAQSTPATGWSQLTESPGNPRFRSFGSLREGGSVA